MADQLAIIGVGPGGTEWVTPEALAAIEAAEILIGSHRLLEELGDPEKLCYELTGDLAGLRLNLLAWQDRQIAILVSGDPGFYSILDWIKREFSELELKVIPGISSMQLAFARCAQSWYDCKFISLHGRVFPDLTTEINLNRKVCLLTDEKNSPTRIITSIQAAGICGKRIFIGSALGTPAERVWQGMISEYQPGIFDQTFCVVIIEDEALAL